MFLAFAHGLEVCVCSFERFWVLLDLKFGRILRVMAGCKRKEKWTSFTERKGGKRGGAWRLVDEGRGDQSTIWGRGEIVYKGRMARTEKALGLGWLRWDI